MDGCDRRAPVRDLYTSRCPGEVYVGCSSVSRGGAIIRPDSPGASRAGSGDCALACDVPSAAMPPARMKEAIRFRVIGGSFRRGDRSFAGPLLCQLGAHARTAWSILAEILTILRRSLQQSGSALSTGPNRHGT